MVGRLLGEEVTGFNGSDPVRGRGIPDDGWKGGGRGGGWERGCVGSSYNAEASKGAKGCI